jgi:hypothetical protein
MKFITKPEGAGWDITRRILQMRKFTLTFTLLIISALSLQAQFFFMGKDNAHVYQGGENGKNYAAIFSTKNTTRQESIRQCVEYLSQYKIITDENAVLASLKEYDDTQSEFTVPVSFRFGWHGTAPTMGAVAPLPPMYLTADLRFQFYDEGKIRITVQNLGEETYYELCYHSRGNKTQPGDVLNEDELALFKGHRITPTLQDGMGKFQTKLLLVLNSKADRIGEVDKALEDFLDNIDEQILLVDKLVKVGSFFYGTPEEILALWRDMVSKDDAQGVNASMVELLEKEIAQEKLVCVYPKFWKQDIKLEFDYFFIAFNTFFGGEIEGIAEDGEQTWELVDGKLLPTDSKLRKQLIKNKQDYFSYYQ